MPQVKAILSRYSVEFEKWRCGIVLHNANVLDPASSKLRIGWGVQADLITPKVKHTKMESPNDAMLTDSSSS